MTVLLHEFGHGLGFSGFYNKSTGALLAGFPDVYGTYTFNTTVNKSWPQMTDAQRAAATIDTNHVVWTGINVTAAVPNVLQFGTPLVDGHHAGRAGQLPGRHRHLRPGPRLAGRDRQRRSSALDAADAAGPSTTDGCSTITTNLTGKIGLVDRGTCGFVVKAKNLQNAGAIGVLIADNVAGSPPAGMSGVDPTVTIPSVRISLANGNATQGGARQRHGQRHDRRQPRRPRRRRCPAAGRSSTPRTRWSPARPSRTGIRSPSRTCSWSRRSTPTSPTAST